MLTQKDKEHLKEIEEFMKGIDVLMKKEIESNCKESRIFMFHHQRNRYVFNKGISRELYKFLVEKRIIDHPLICYWKRSGFENLCCLGCIQDTKYGNVCLCRVPQRNLKEIISCDFCGCRGCSGY